jgi:peptidoglycan/LPS O-acetylase OafA/YrhL
MGLMQSNTSAQWAVLALLRALLALIVVATHLAWFIPETPDWLQTVWELDGKSAVIGFLLVSGYSIHASLSAKEDGFIQRRFLRIYPLYFICILFTVALEYWQGGMVEVSHHRFEAEGAIAAMGNLLLLQMFLVKAVAFNGPVWSISIEFFYYLCASKFRKYGTLAAAIVVLSLLCFVLPRRSDLGFVYSAVTKFAALTYAWPWITGFFLWRGKSVWVLLSLAAGAVAVAISPYYISGRYALLTYFFSVAVILLSNKIKVSDRLCKVFNLLGDLSYPLYLVHVPVFILLHVAFQATSPVTYSLVAILSALSLLMIIDKYVAKKYVAPWIKNFRILRTA